MEKNFELGIEISEGVLNTNIPRKIKRYYEVEKKSGKAVSFPKIISSQKTHIYRYRPGVNSFMIGDLDV